MGGGTGDICVGVSILAQFLRILVLKRDHTMHAYSLKGFRV